MDYVRFAISDKRLGGIRFELRDTQEHRPASNPESDLPSTSVIYLKVRFFSRLFEWT